MKDETRETGEREEGSIQNPCSKDGLTAAWEGAEERESKDWGREEERARHGRKRGGRGKEGTDMAAALSCMCFTSMSS